VVLAVLVAALALAACGDDDGAESERSSTTGTEATTTSSSTTTTTVPEREPSTTTTAFDPATVEGQVEAAYLRSWDVYADAVYHLELDEDALAEVFTGEHLETKRSEIQSRIEDRRAALVRVEHRYTIQLVDPSTAVVLDVLTNHQVLIDPETKSPIEEDPNEVLSDAVTLRLEGGSWKVARKDRV